MVSAPQRRGGFALKLFATIGVICTGIGIVLALAMVARCAGGGGRVAEQTVLELDLDRMLTESGADDPFSQVTGRQPNSFRKVIDTLDRASKDDRVVGLIAYLGSANHGMARTQELRSAIARFRESGKYAYAYAETFGELTAGNQSYYLAAAFDEVWLQPTGALGLTGLISESMFVKEALDKLEVRPEGDRRREYKNAFNMYTETAYTPAHREAAQAILDDLHGQMVADIAMDRKMDPSDVNELIANGPYVGPEALASGLVDRLAYRDEVLAAAKERAGKGAQLLYGRRYLERARPLHRTGERKIAVIYGVGAVMRGSSNVDPITGESTLGSDTVTAAFRAAIEDDDVAAIVFRVDSPGGSAVASDAVWRETVRAKEAGKPVIVTMGNVAGSGGYYVAAAADKIVAEPGTITGSIGVLAGKPVVRGLWKKLGVTWDSVSTSPNADMFSTLEPYDDAQRARLGRWLDWVYDDFKQRVADGRGMSLDQVEKVAKGRIWSGARAKELGLVDELGGFETALRLAKEAAAIEADEDVRLIQLPRPKGLVDRLLADPPESSEDRRALAESELVTGLERWRPVAQRLTELGLGPNDQGVLTMMPVSVGP